MTQQEIDALPIGYKVVMEVWHTIKPARLISCYAPHALDYEPGKWTWRPPDWGPLALFSSPDHARAFIMETWCLLQVWECRYIPSHDDGLWVPDKTYRHGHGRNYCRNYYDGTLYAERILLTERIA